MTVGSFGPFLQALEECSGRDSRRQRTAGAHCWHAYTGPIHMVIPDGHIVQKCCNCPDIRTIHADHAREERGNNRQLPGRYDDGHGTIFR